MISNDFYLNNGEKTVNIKFGESKMKKSQDKKTYEIMKNFFDEIRLNVPETGDFDTVLKQFNNDECRIFIGPSHISGEENLRRLHLGYKIPDTSNMKSLQVLKGTKQEILDFLGNQKNEDTINQYLELLKESADG